ncbi:hypothetical protein B0T10DRAFT_461536 [Thelonectria olida]|uniref:Uncharacterized protein n=1 Tax=Thelonectria olida TaxID=1576542 RepID=A0A9P8W0U3_9HYPO|nr:hypothetical protein B0T10DRAFT_461536 [Thelonectria olida]
MWEVVWTDPQRESKKEHRERKTGERSQREKEKAARKSTSTRSSSSSSGKAFTSFSVPRSHGGPLSPVSTRSFTSIASGTSHGLDHDGASTISAISEPSPPEPWYGTNTNRPLRRDEGIVGYPSSPNWPLDSSSPTPLPLSRWNNTLAKSSYRSIQSLGPGSVVTRSTEVVISLRTDEIDAKDMGPTVTITANPFDEVPLLRPRSSEDLPQSSSLNRPGGGLFPRERPSLYTLRKMPSWHTRPETPNSDGWKPPNIWECTSPVDIPITSVDSPNLLLP